MPASDRTNNNSYTNTNFYSVMDLIIIDFIYGIGDFSEKYETFRETHSSALR